MIDLVSGLHFKDELICSEIESCKDFYEKILDCDIKVEMSYGHHKWAFIYLKVQSKKVEEVDFS